MRYAPFYGCMISLKYPQFEAAVRKTCPALGMELVDLEGFSCCPDPIYFKAGDKMIWLTLAARNLCIAEEAGLDIITMCSGCTATLSEAHHILEEDPGLRDEVNIRLKKVGKEYKGEISVRHIVTVLRDDVGLEKVAASVTRPLDDLVVAIHYGCHLLKPSKIMRVDDPNQPTILEDLTRLVGATPVVHSENLLCCGKACISDEMPAEMTRDILDGIAQVNADCMGLICPTCFDEFDLGQLRLSRRFHRKFNIPVVYYFQLLGLAQGLSPRDMGLHMHKIKVHPLLEKLGLPTA
ncbi:MAG: CoB--CoM heterodisulfide reductase subunit B [Candidatus Eisenbacteria sp.]|nr:CoB--CoM heterodisulfide reductase subunit B [Candidatus Eisenbacteria bacterium]